MIKKLHSILNEFKNPEFFIETKIHRKIRDFNVKNFKSKKTPTDSEFFYEEVAFAFLETKNPPSEWGDTFYAPLFGYNDSITQKWTSCYPDIQNITPKMIDYWEERSNEVDNPILKCRYSGLVWDFSQKIKKTNPNISIAHSFIDAVIEMAHLGGDSFLKHKLERSLRLAVSLTDRKNIISIRDAIIKYEDAYSEEGKIGTWGYSYDFLIGDKDLNSKIQLNQKQEDKIIEELERKLKVFSDKNSNNFNSHSVEYIVTKLAPYYKNKNDKENMRRVLLTYKDSFLSIENNLVTVDVHSLEKIRKILFQHGLSNEAKELEPKIRSLQKKFLDSLKKFETNIEIPAARSDKYISELDRRNLSEALYFIAFSFIPNKEHAKDIVLETAKEYPFQALIPHSIIEEHTGREIAKIGPVEDDLEGRTVHQISQAIDLGICSIALGLNHLKENKSLNADSLSKHLFKSPVFLNTNHQTIKQGLIAYFDKNYIFSCSVLIHQVESAVRELISIAGGKIYRAPKNSKETEFELKSLGALLRDEIFIKVFENLNSDIPIFLKILLVDQRSLNIRNSICHGYPSETVLNKKTATHIIHVLLILSIFREIKNSSKE